LRQEHDLPVLAGGVAQDAGQLAIHVLHAPLGDSGGV
jgi:hypothetical protein